MRGRCDVDKTKEELCRMRIKVLQEVKENMAKKMHPLMDDATADLYATLYDGFNKLIDEEVSYFFSR